MTDSIKVAVVGAGYFARFQIDAWQRLEDVELVAICDLDRQKLDDAAKMAPQAKCYTDATRMLDELSPGILDIATPPETHQSLVQVAAGRCATIVCQKPLAPSYQQAAAIVEAAALRDSLLVVHENFRFMPWHREQKRLIGESALGKLHSVSMRLRPGDGQGPRAYLDRQPYFQTMQRFLIHETAIHFIDTFRFLFGEINGVFARLRRINPAIRGEDAGYVVFDFSSGATGLFDGNRLNDHDSDNTRRTMGEMWIEGELGVLRLDGRGRLWMKPHGDAETEHTYQWNDSGFGGDCVFHTQAHIVAHLRDPSSAPLYNLGRDYLRNIEIEDAIYQSAATERWHDV